MIHHRNFSYKPYDDENDKASNSYLMSLIAIIVGLPLPIINLLSTFIFYLGNRNSTYFVRWHSTQALLSQVSIFFINSVAFYWTLSILFWGNEISNLYIAYLITAFIYNLTEFVVTIYTAIQVRKGKHIEWFFYGDLTSSMVRPDINKTH